MPNRSRPQFFDVIRKAATDRWSQIERDPELGAVWRLMFGQVQNPRHVLSELLQNADDAGATEASATVENGSFLFRHNGHDFSQEEFESLCRFGFSNKRRLLTIGFRGIGFKSVFSLGPIAAVLTPTLAFLFNRKRFTQPEWFEINSTNEDTLIWVQIESPEKEQAIRIQIEAWAKSAVPLLFFENIRTLRLFDRIIHVEDDGPGPSDTSKRVKLSGMEGGGILFRSKEEPFPEACRDEVRSERFEPDLDLPPCEVVILLSPLQQQRLYCVLPTDVGVSLPFSCHAPFVQDPARTGIMEPVMSPTNAWLLDRIGKLAAESMLTWLAREDLSLPERARAYDLLPEATALNAATISGAATLRIIEAFRKVIEHEKILLCSNGKLDSQSYTARLPRAVADAWGAETARMLFSPGKRSVMAREVAPGARSRLQDWKMLDPASFAAIFAALSDGTKPLPPRPEGLETLAAFWAFANENQPDPWGVLDWWRKAAIIPLAGKGHLGRANGTLSSRSQPEKCPATDWQFITDRAEVLDDDWRKLIDWIKEKPAEALRELESKLDRRLKDKDLAGIVDGFRKTKLDQAPSLDQVFEQVAPRIFGAGPPKAADAIRFVQIAAKLDVSLPASVSVKFLCVDGQWRGRSDGLLARSDIDLEYLLPEPWLGRHLISPEYEAGMQASEIVAWRKWAVQPQKGGLAAFARPVASPVVRVWNLDAAFFRARGGSFPARKWATVMYECTDFNWDRAILDHWNRLVLSHGTSIWLDIAWAVISAWSTNWEALACYQVHQERSSRVRLDDRKTAATWFHDLRNRACVPDTYGVPRLPVELLRRTPETSALLDIEPFVLERWDTAEHQIAMDKLGVRTQATDTSKILDRLRALSRVEDPPIGPLRDLYRAIERVMPRLPAYRVIEVVAAFASEALIRTEGFWERSGFCFRSNPGAIPGVSVLHQEIRELIGLWDKLKIAPQPSAEDALRWFGSLPLEGPLGESDRKAAAAVLDLYPLDVWTRQERWLSLQGRIARTSNLRWGCLEPRAVLGLFTNVRGETADFSMLDSVRLNAVLPVRPRLIETALERRVLGYVPGHGTASREEPWLQALGQILSRLERKDGAFDEAAVEGDRRAGQRLTRTRWVSASTIRVQPYLDGVSAGSQTTMSTAWIRDSLYVEGDSVHAYKVLVEELQRPFQTPEARGIIRDCVGRDPTWIQAYADAHLDLADHAGTGPQGEPVPSPTVAPDSAGSVFPKPVEARQDESLQQPVGQADFPKPQTNHAGSAQDATGEEANGRERTAPAREPSKLDRLTTFLLGRGFLGDASSGMFVHPDGSFVHRSEGIFAWELVSPTGVNPMWLAATSLSDDGGIELPAEVWNAAGRYQAVLLSPEAGGYHEVPFAVLRAEFAAQKLEVYPAVYRIRIPDEREETVSATGSGSAIQRSQLNGADKPGGADGSPS